MRLIALLALASVITATGPIAAAAGAPEIVRVWPGYRTAESFTRISEYFNGAENTGGQTVLRSQPASRAGYYFLLRTKSAAALSAARVTLQVITPAATDPLTFNYATTLPAGGHVFQVGLTGADWASPETRPVAWRLSVHDAAGTEVAAEQSFLWSLPPGS